MLNESTQRDAAHLGILSSAAQAFEQWHNAQVEVIHKRMIRRHITDDKGLEIGAMAVQMPPAAVFTDFREIDAELRRSTATDVDDRRRIAQVRTFLHDSMTDLCDFELDRAIDQLEDASKMLDFLVGHKTRGGDRRNRMLDGATAARLGDVLTRVEALLREVTRVRALVAA